MKIATKHTLLIAIISFHTLSLARIVTKILGVHHINITSAISRRMVIDDQSKALWSLNARRKWINGLLDVAKRVVTDW